MITEDMIRIRLKPFSAEYEDDAPQAPESQRCDMPGCARQASHKAPRDRSLSSYYRFCLEHTQDYNNAWDYFAGMAQQDIENHILNSLYGDRPTRRYDGMAKLEEALYEKAWQAYRAGESEPKEKQKRAIDNASPEFQAMELMGLEPPLAQEAVKIRYRELVKKYHPDVNGNSLESQEILKKINMAYTILKLAADKFSELK